MKKFLVIAIIFLIVIVGLFENTGEDVPEETKAVETKTEQTSDKDDNKSRSETTDEDKAESKRKHEEEKAKGEQAAKEKEKEEQKAKEEQEAKEKAKEEEKEAQAKAEEEKQRKENEAKEKEEQEAKEKADAEQIYLQLMRENVGSYVDIQFDKTDKIYTMTPTDQGLIDEISMLPMGIGHEDWGVLVDGMTSMSKSGKDLVGEGYTMNLVNPLNQENVILWIVDGEVIYNVIDDL